MENQCWKRGDNLCMSRFSSVTDCSDGRTTAHAVIIWFQCENWKGSGLLWKRCGLLSKTLDLSSIIAAIKITEIYRISVFEMQLDWICILKCGRSQGWCRS